MFLGDQEHQAHAVIIATGAKARQIGLESERKLQGRGVSYCATCDAVFFRNKRVVVVGGGDSAMEEATFLTKFADEVVIVHRRAELRASKVMQDRARHNPKITWELGYVVEDVLGGNTLEAVRIRDLETGEVRDIPADGLFVAIGHDPNTSLFTGLLDMDENGYLLQQPGSTATNVAGRVRRRRRRRPHLPAGRHRGRIRLRRGARRRALADERPRGGRQAAAWPSERAGRAAGRARPRPRPDRLHARGDLVTAPRHAERHRDDRVPQQHLGAARPGLGAPLAERLAPGRLPAAGRPAARGRSPACG